MTFPGLRFRLLLDDGTVLADEMVTHAELPGAPVRHADLAHGHLAAGRAVTLEASDPDDLVATYLLRVVPGDRWPGDP